MKTSEYWLEQRDAWAAWVGLLSLRLLLGWEYFEAGLEKLQGENWFFEIQSQFPLPFNLLPVSLNWTLVTYVEILGGLALVLGLRVRCVALVLCGVTWVALLSVHWPEHWDTWHELFQGYRFTNQGFGNFKLPVIFLCMLWPLLFLGGGRLSLDYCLHRYLTKKSAHGQ